MIKGRAAVTLDFVCNSRAICFIPARYFGPYRPPRTGLFAPYLPRFDPLHGPYGLAGALDTCTIDVGTHTYVEVCTRSYVNPYLPLIQVRIETRTPVFDKWLFATDPKLKSLAYEYCRILKNLEAIAIYRTRMATTVAQQKALAIAPKFSAFASLVGSSLIAILILRQRHNKSDTPKASFHRLMLGMALTDMSASAAWFFTTWPIPRGTPGVYGAVGNQQTCSAQAFFAQFSLSTVMYNASLAIYFLLVIGNMTLWSKFNLRTKS